MADISGVNVLFYDERSGTGEPSTMDSAQDQSEADTKYQRAKHGSPECRDGKKIAALPSVKTKPMKPPPTLIWCMVIPG
jgi:hypothetical protein